MSFLLRRFDLRLPFEGFLDGFDFLFGDHVGVEVALISLTESDVAELLSESGKIGGSDETCLDGCFYYDGELLAFLAGPFLLVRTTKFN